MDSSHRQPNQFDLFLYTGDETRYEDLTRYEQYGLHPILLGDVLPKKSTCVDDPAKLPRYRIILKLGFGAFSTVWLARDLVDKRYVAVKVCLGSATPHRDRETDILSQFRQHGQGKPGYHRIIQLLDVFIIQGPNGFHECLVTEVVSPLNDPDVRQQCSSEVICQIVEGFAFLHDQGIAHGDPHVGNFGIALPQLDLVNEDDIVEYFANPEIVPVVQRDSSFPLHSMPPYVVQSVSIGELSQAKKCFPASSEMAVKILNFGRSFRTSKKTPLLPGAVADAFRPPEVVIHQLDGSEVGSMWSIEAEIWAVGCTLYHIRSGNELVSTWGSLDDYLIRAIRLGGSPPTAWPDKWKFCDRQHNASRSLDRAEAWEVREADRNRLRFPRDEEREDFLGLVKEMVVTKPNERCQMAKLMTHSFFRRERTHK